MAGRTLPATLRYPLVAGLVLGALLALFGPAGEPLALRSEHYLWDLGHVGLGIAMTVGLHWLWPPLSRLRAWQQAAVILGLALVLGGGSEILQGLTGRDASWRDLTLDVTGAGLALLGRWAASSRRARRQRVVAALSGGLIVVLLTLPWLAYREDERTQEQQFPVLINGESPWEAGRFDTAERVALATEAGFGERLCLPAGKRWGGVSLRYFPGDWRGYQALEYRVFLTGETSLPVFFRLNDREHLKRGQFTLDRYNALVTFHPGWNHFRLKLDEVLHTPGGRIMDASEIEHLRWFTAQTLTEPRCFILDDLRLTR